MFDETLSRTDGAETPTATGAAPVPPAGYELLDEVGRGGMGVVYRARDVSLNREVAVKVLAERYAAGSAAAVRFLDEAQITGQLQHPGIPAVYRVGELPDGRPFLAMKLIKGDTLEARLKAGTPMDPLAVFEAVGQAVGYAHAHGVIHRDLKPQNVMVGAFGEVQVMDWGLAKVLARCGPERPPDDPEATLGVGTEIKTARDSDSARTLHGSVLGTPAFMPPEQAAGESDKVGARSDVFGLGAILCVLLTGKPPFAGGTAESVRLNAVRGKTEEAFARLDASAADPGVVALCKRCLAFEPADRPATADEVATAVGDLRRAADDRARQAERDKHAGEVRAAERRKRVRVAAGLAGLVFAAVLAGGAAALVQWRRADAALADLRVEEAKAQAALAQVTSEQARTQQALATADRAAVAARAGLVGWLRHSASQTKTTTTDFEFQFKQAAESTARLHALLKDSLTAMPPGRDQMLLEAECNRLLADILSEGVGMGTGSDGTTEYRTSAALTRKLLAAEPDSVPLRRQLADCLYKLSTSRTDPGGESGDRDSLTPSALCGGVYLVMAARLNSPVAIRRRTLGTIRESIEVRRSLGTDLTTQDQKLLAKSFQVTSDFLFQQSKLASEGDVQAVTEALQSEETIYRSLSSQRSDESPFDDFARYQFRQNLATCLIRQADFAFVQSGDRRAASQLLDRAVGEMGPNTAGIYKYTRKAELRVRCKVLSVEKNHPSLAGAAREWDAVMKGLPNHWADSDAHLPAAYLARCVKLVLAEAAGTAPEREATATRYADDAVAVLAEMPASERLSKAVHHDMFAPLRTHPPFQRLLLKHPLSNKALVARAIKQLRDDPAGAVAAAGELVPKTDLNGGEVYDLACVYAVACDKLPGKREEYAARAVELLRRAIAAGYKDRAHMDKDADLDALRGRADYKQLLTTLPNPPPPKRAKE